jgi:valine dehydrogenase (NAD+)
MAVFGQGHEQVVFCADPSSGLQAIIAVHSTALGPALGGTRFRAYRDESSALTDVLALSAAMTYKNALAGLDHGGGKAVIIGDPRTTKTEALLRAYGRFVDSLAGRYITACDVGTVVADMDVVARETRHATGRSTTHGGAGDSGILTALGVFQGMRACAAHRWGTASLAGRRVGVAGVGKVGRRLVDHLVADGAQVVVADPDAEAVARLREALPEVTEVASAAALTSGDLDVYSPNALGGAVDAAVAEQLKATVVCGGANNQLADPDLAQLLADRGVLYAPDYLVNAGGVIQVADELEGFSEPRARARVEQIFDTTLAVLERAASAGVTPEAAADRLAEERIATVGRFSGALGLPGH